MLHKRNKSKIIFFRESTFKVAELIFNYPNKVFHIRELAKKTKLSTTAVMGKYTLGDLQKFGIITVKKTQITTEIKANLESESYAFYKKIFNLYRLERYNIILGIKDAFNAKTIVLFGSFAKGEDIEESDIDILIITSSKIKKDLENLDVLEKHFNRKINLHILPSLNKSSKEFKNAVANGIVLHGYLDLI